MHMAKSSNSQRSLMLGNINISIKISVNDNLAIFGSVNMPGMGQFPLGVILFAVEVVPRHQT